MTPVLQKTAEPMKGPSLKRLQEESSESDDEPRQFRRVRIRCRQRARKKSSTGEAESETLEFGDETIRCICGAQFNLGIIGNSSEHAPPRRPITAWLIQCGDCKVWQHRSCVGTANGSDPPEGYYCERCPRSSSQPSQVPRISPLRSPAVPEYLPLSEKLSTPERSTSSLKAEPTNGTNGSDTSAEMLSSPGVIRGLLIDKESSHRSHTHFAPRAIPVKQSPTNMLENPPKKYSIVIRGEFPSGEEDSSSDEDCFFDEKMPNQPMQSFVGSFDEFERMTTQPKQSLHTLSLKRLDEIKTALSSWGDADPWSPLHRRMEVTEASIESLKNSFVHQKWS